MKQRQTLPGAILVALAFAMVAGSAGHAQRLVDPKVQSELDRGKALESDVEAELRRQEELLRSIDLDKETERALQAATQEEVDLLERADTRVAPKAPTDRNLPLAIFDSETIEVPAASWTNNKKAQVIRRSLDADRDGNPEQIRFVDKQTGVMIRKESDRDYDGTVDSWATYRGGAITRQDIDSDGNGRIDQWETYSRGRMKERSIDRDGDGRKDAFYRYEGESLVEESHDHNNDGKPDLVVNYQDRVQVKKQEDRSKDGRIDTWVNFGVHGDREIPIRIERDSDNSGKVDIIETFDISSGKPIIERREEDRDGDGSIDVISIYKNGKLKKREFTNPDVVDL